MKALLCLLALANLDLIVASAQTPGSEHPIVVSTRLRLTAAIDPASAKLHVPITVKLTLKNTSSKIASVVDTSPEYDFELVVADSSGKEPPRTALGNRMSQGKFVLLRSNRQDLEPGREIVSEIDVTKIYQITRPGTYYLRASHRNILPDPEDPRNAMGGGVETSNRKSILRPDPVHCGAVARTPAGSYSGGKRANHENRKVSAPFSERLKPDHGIFAPSLVPFRFSVRPGRLPDTTTRVREHGSTANFLWRC